MIAIEIHVNGERALVAGVSDMGLLNANVIRAKRYNNPTGTRAVQKYLEDFVRIDVSAWRPNGDRVEKANWMKRDLTVGDVVTLKIVETNEVDAATTVEDEGTALSRWFKGDAP